MLNQEICLDFTKHCQERKNNRGITEAQISITLKYGKLVQDRYILRPKDVDKLLAKMKKTAMQETRKHARSQGKKARVPHYSPETLREMRVLKQIADKGGVVVVEDSNRCITVFHFTSKHWADFSRHYTVSHKHNLMN